MSGSELLHSCIRGCTKYCSTLIISSVAPFPSCNRPSLMTGADDMDEAQTVVNEVKQVLGTNRSPADKEAMTQEGAAAENYPIITKRTAVAALATVLARVEAVLASLDWLLTRLKLMPPPGALVPHDCNFASPGSDVFQSS